MSVAEQLGGCPWRPGGHGVARRFMKRQTARWLRRLAKRYLEDAPKRRVYRGWFW